MNNKLKLSLVQLLIIAISIFAVITPAALGNGNPSNPPPPSGFVPNSTIRIYGDGFPQGNAPERYDYWQEPFNPTVIPKDSITFNPAILNWSSQYPMSAGSVDSDLKTYLRAWYEPEGWYKGPKKNNLTYPTINLEYTYMLIDDQDKLPWHGSAGDTMFAFPITGNLSQTGLALYENTLASGFAATPNLVKLSSVRGNVTSYNKNVTGTISIEKKYYLASGEAVQFLDHKLQYVGTDLNGNNAVVRVWYTGNLQPDTPSIVILPMNQKEFFKRHNEMRSTSSHPDDGGEPISWYANFEFKTQDHMIAIDVGKELDYSDVFYVNGVRYDVAAVEVLDSTGSTPTEGQPLVADQFKYITLRTKLPKCVGTVPDESVVTSQVLDCIAVNETLPVLPPFNVNHAIVDDINVPLWRPLKLHDKWPVGDPDGQLGITYFPEAEKYLTQQYPPYQWLLFFRAVPIGVPGLPSDWQLWEQYGGPFYPGNDVPEGWWMDENLWLNGPSHHTVFDTSKWIAMDVKKRIIGNVDPLNVYYIAETIEPRLSTDLLEVLNETNIGEENLYENWTKFDIQTLPDQYTEFVLPSIPDLNVSSYTVQGINSYYQLPGDYLITTSLRKGRTPYMLADSFVGTHLGDFPDKRVAFAFDQSKGSDGQDIYINADKFDSSKNVTLRIYGDHDFGPPGVYQDWQDPFDPTVIPKDSVTFDAAILNWSSDYPMSAGSVDSDLKTYFRMYYVPSFEFKKVDLPAIVTETTYMLLDDQDKLPWHGIANNTWFAFPIAEDPSTTQIGLELFENNLSSGSYAATPNLTMLAGVSGTVNDSYNKTVNGTIRLEKKYYLEDPSVGGTTVQFLDHKLKFLTTSGDVNATTAVVEIYYAGNENDDYLGTFNLEQSTTYYIGRHGPLSLVPIHGGSNPTTWYVHYEFKTQDHKAAIDVGKELSRGDIFYVDSVRYEVPAIEVLDNTGDTSADLFKYITIRTPFPKDPTNSTFTTQTIDDGLCTVGDCPGTPGIGPSSQRIHKIPPSQWLPVLPPLNMQHSIVDDTDVVLWTPLKWFDKWPIGDPKGKLNIEYFPTGERYLTQQNPPSAWLKFFRAVPIGAAPTTDWQLWNGPYYPGTGFDPEKWIANDVKQRITGPIPALQIYWVNETWEERYSTNLLEILNETITGTSPIVESWTKYDIQTLPDMYTSFKLPVIPSVNTSVYISGDYQNYFSPDTRAFPGSYIVTTSFEAPNAIGDLYNRYDPDDRRYAFTFNASNGIGLYINEDPVPEVQEAAKWLFYLQPGVQYISAPQIPAVADPVSVFGPDVTVWGWDPVSGWYYPTAIEGGKGYYVFSPTRKLVSVVGTDVGGITWNGILPSLRPGWNLIGPGGTEVVVDSLNSPSGGITAIFGYNPATGWNSLGKGSSLLRGQGYWILVGP